VYAHWGFARINGIGWRWAGVIWIFTVVTYIPLDILKFVIRLGLSGRAWDNMIDNKVRSLYKTFSISPFFLCFMVLMDSTDTSNWIYVSGIWYVLVSVRHYIFSITSIIKNYNRCLCVSVSNICQWFGI
jgi:hypothetical protein